MSISIYKTLMESYEHDSLKDYIKTRLFKVQDLISQYIDEEDEESYSDLLGLILNNLNDVINKFSSLGFTYEPSTTSDVEEDIFQTILSRYSDSIESFIRDFSRDLFESFNVQTRDTANLIDLHRTRYIKEGEVLVDLSE